jgi:hypothetical protein
LKLENKEKRMTAAVLNYKKDQRNILKVKRNKDILIKYGRNLNGQNFGYRKM